MEKGSEVERRISNRLEQGKLKAMQTPSTLVYLLSVLNASSLLFLHGHSEYSILQEHAAPDLLLHCRPLLGCRDCCSVPSTSCPPPVLTWVLSGLLLSHYLLFSPSYCSIALFPSFGLLSQQAPGFAHCSGLAAVGPWEQREPLCSVMGNAGLCSQFTSVVLSITKSCCVNPIPILVVIQ